MRLHPLHLILAYIALAAGAAALALLRSAPVPAPGGIVPVPAVPMEPPGPLALLSAPYLQAPGQGQVHVRWLTNFGAGRHTVWLGRPVAGAAELAQLPADPVADARSIPATTLQVPMLFEDGASRIPAPPPQPRQVLVYRHEARVDGLQGGRHAYWIESITPDGQRFVDGPNWLAAAPARDAPVRLLLTSDFQQRRRALAGLAAAETLGPFDGILFAGDLVNHPRRASHWISRHRNGWETLSSEATEPAFFDAMQARHGPDEGARPAAGGRLLQHAALFPAVGNHEVSGRMLLGGPRPDGAPASIADGYNLPQPAWAAPGSGHAAGGAGDGHDFETYRALFRTPAGPPEVPGAYATRVGEVFLVTLDVSRIWRPWRGRPGRPGRLGEAPEALDDLARWGFGEFLFTRIDAASPQIEWLRGTLRGEDARGARYRVVMLHQSGFGLGHNAVPVLAEPEIEIHATGPDGAVLTSRIALPADPAARARAFDRHVRPHLGRLTAVRYHYPRHKDHFRKVLEPLFRDAGVDLVLQGHSHIWNRFESDGMHLLETSHLGNCFGAFWNGPDGTAWRGAQRPTPPWQDAAGTWGEPADYPATGDPWGRVPVPPTGPHPMVATGESADPLPFVCSERLSVFSVLDSADGTVTSYAVDATRPDAVPVAFDRFTLGSAR